MNKENEKLCLKWNEFQENTSSTFVALKEDTEFADVTLACEDGQQVEAHKVILSSSSLFFSNLLRKMKHPHPLIFMRGTNIDDLKAMVDFLYIGEAKVYQGNLGAFLALAEELKVKGLMESSVKKDIENTINAKTQSKIFPSQIKPKSFSRQELINHQIPELDVLKSCTKSTLDEVKFVIENKTEDDFHEDENEAETDDIVEESVFRKGDIMTATIENLNEKIKSMMETSKKLNVGKSKGRARICKVCGKEGQLVNMQYHIETQHITGLSHECDTCGKVFSARHGLAVHKSTFHKK